MPQQVVGDALDGAGPHLGATQDEAAAIVGGQGHLGEVERDRGVGAASAMGSEDISKHDDELMIHNMMAACGISNNSVRS